METIYFEYNLQGSHHIIYYDTLHYISYALQNKNNDSHIFQLY